MSLGQRGTDRAWAMPWHQDGGVFSGVAAAGEAAGEEALLTVEDAAVFLCMTRAQVLKKWRQGMPGLSFGPKDIRFVRSELVAYGRQQAGRGVVRR